MAGRRGGIHGTIDHFAGIHVLPRFGPLDAAIGEGRISWPGSWDGLGTAGSKAFLGDGMYCRSSVSMCKWTGYRVAKGLSRSFTQRHPEEESMLRWALAFFIIALVAAVFGFWGIVAAATGVAKVLFFLFLVLFLVSLLGGLMRRA